MPILYDYLPSDYKAQTPLGSFTKQGLSVMSTPVPDGTDPAQVSRVLRALAPAIEKNVLPSFRTQPNPAGVAAANQAESWAGVPAPMQAALQFGQGGLDALPSFRSTPAPTAVPPPQNLVQRAARIAGGVTGFAAVATPITIATEGAAAPALGAKAAATVAGMAGAGVAAGAAAGSPKERIVRTATMAATAGALHGAEALATAPFAEGSAAAARAASATGIAGGAVGFGAAQPAVTNYLLNKWGEKVQPLTLDDMVQGSLEMGAVGVLTGGRGLLRRDVAPRVAPTIEATPPIESTPAQRLLPSHPIEMPADVQAATRDATVQRRLPAGQTAREMPEPVAGPDTEAAAAGKEAMRAKVESMFDPSAIPLARAREAKEMSDRLTTLLQSQREVSIQPPEASEPLRVGVARVMVVPGDAVEVRVLGVTADGTVVPMEFPKVKDLVAGVKSGPEDVGLRAEAQTPAAISSPTGPSQRAGASEVSPRRVGKVRSEETVALAAAGGAAAPRSRYPVMHTRANGEAIAIDKMRRPHLVNALADHLARRSAGEALSPEEGKSLLAEVKRRNIPPDEVAKAVEKKAARIVEERAKAAQQPLAPVEQPPVSVEPNREIADLVKSPEQPPEAAPQAPAEKPKPPDLQRIVEEHQRAVVKVQSAMVGDVPRGFWSRDGRRLMVIHRSTSEPGGYRITDIDPSVGPTGHSEFKTREEAVKELAFETGGRSATDAEVEAAMAKVPPTSQAEPGQEKPSSAPPAAAASGDRRPAPPSEPEAPPPAAEPPKEMTAAGKRAFAAGESVGIPYGGKSKRITREHGTVLGYVDVNGEPHVNVRDVRGKLRTFPEYMVARIPRKASELLKGRESAAYDKAVKAVGGNLEKAVAMEKQARSEYNALEEEAKAQQGPMQEERRGAGGRPGEEAAKFRRMRDRMRALEPTVNALARVVKEMKAEPAFDPWAEHPSQDPMWGEHLDMLAKERPERMDPETHRRFDEMHGEIFGPRQLRSAFDARNAMLDAHEKAGLGALDMPAQGVSELEFYVQRRSVDMAADALTAEASALKEKYPNPSGPEAVLFKAQAARLARAAEIAQKWSPEAFAQRVTEMVKSGHSFQQAFRDAAGEMNYDLDSLGSEAGRTILLSQLGGGFVRAGQRVLHTLLQSRLVDGVGRALDRQRRALGRNGVAETLLDAEGNVLRRDPEPWGGADYWDQYFLLRATHRFPIFGRLGIGGGTLFLPPRERAAANKAQVEPSMIQLDMHERLHGILGDEGFRYLGGDYGPGDRLMWKALDGDRAALAEMPDWVQARVPQVAKLYDEMIEKAIARANQRGVKAPNKRSEYVPWLINELWASDFKERIERVLDRSATSDELPDLAMRFFLDRTGYKPEHGSFLRSWNAYLTGYSRKMGLDPAMDVWEKWLKGPGVDDPIRAGAVRDWIQSHYFRGKGRLEKSADDFLRDLYFKQHREAIRSVSMEQARNLVGQGPLIDAASRLAEGKAPDRAVVIKPGSKVKFTAGKGSWVEVGRTPNGDAVYVGNNGHAVGTAQLRMPFEWLLDVKSAFQRPAAGLSPEEAVLQRELRQRDERMALERNPFASTMGNITGKYTKNVMWMNLSSTFQNSFTNYITTYPEYGLPTTMKAVASWTAGKGFQALRSAVEADLKNATEQGWLSKEDGRAWMNAAPMLAHEILLDSAGLRQGETQFIKKLAERVDKGMSPQQAQAVQYLSGLGPFMLAESLTRGVEMHAGTMDALRRGYTMDDIAGDYERSEIGRQQLREDILKSFDDPLSVTNRLAVQGALTMYAYNPMGQGYYMTDPVGRMFGAFTTWPSNYLLWQVLRPTEGLARVAGEKVGLGHATAEHRQAAKAWVRQRLVEGSLLTATALSGHNLMVVGSGPVFVAALQLAKWLSGDDERFKVWAAAALRGELVPIVDPIVSGGSPLERTTGIAGKLLFGRYSQGATLEVFRSWLIKGAPFWKKLVQERPDYFDNDEWRWVADALGVKTFVKTQTLGEQVSHHLRLDMPEGPDALTKKRVHPAKPPKNRRYSAPRTSSPLSGGRGAAL